MADYQYKRKEKRKGKGREEEEKELFVKACSGWQINMLEALSRAEAKKKTVVRFSFYSQTTTAPKTKKNKNLNLMLHTRFAEVCYSVWRALPPTGDVTLR